MQNVLSVLFTSFTADLEQMLTRTLYWIYQRI